MQEAIKKAEVLIEALPYIKRFHKKIIVIKYGGSILADASTRESVLEDIVFLSYMGLRPVLVHGGGPSISERIRNMGKKSEFFQGIRITDTSTLKIVAEELKRLNNQLIKELERLGGKAKGCSGTQNKIIQVKKKKAKIDLGRVGLITGINSKPIMGILKKDTIVVFSPMGIGKDKKIYNINADEVASALAWSLQAEKLVFLTNTKGIMRNPEDPSSFLSTLTIKEAKKLIEDDVIQHGMIPKVNSCIHALESGVKKTHIIDACTPHGLLLEIFTDEGIGTEIIR